MKTIDHLLLVDDSEATNNFHNRLLSRIKFAENIIVTTNGKEGLDYLKQASDCPTLIFLDLNMPVLDGFEFLEQVNPIIAARFETMPTIVVMTSSEEQVDKERCKSLYSKILFYSKPVTVDQIEEISSKIG